MAPKHHPTPLSGGDRKALAKEVGAIHPKAMPVILTTPNEVETWMTAPPEEALKLQRPLPDGSLQIVARGVKEDAGSSDGDLKPKTDEIR